MVKLSVILSFLPQDSSSIFEFATNTRFGDKRINRGIVGVRLCSKLWGGEKDKLILHQICVRATILGEVCSRT